MDTAKRIAQFENMAQADPTNEMAHFSLAKAYGEAGRWNDSAQSYLRCVQLMPDMSKAYQMAGEALKNAGDSEQAAAVLTRGYIVATERGDLMPKNAMAALLTQLGRPLPEVANAPAKAVSVNLSAAPARHDGPVPEGMIVCRQSGRLGTRMTRPPFKGPVGAWIAQHISHESFYKGWVPQGTKVINELRLDLSKPQDQASYDQHMREYLGLDDALLSELNAQSTAQGAGQATPSTPARATT
jgi:Fe-S cluster biosynthesis and repair protein YggX